VRAFGLARVLRENSIRAGSRGILNHSRRDVCPSSSFLRDQLVAVKDASGSVEIRIQHWGHDQE